MMNGSISLCQKVIWCLIDMRFVPKPRVSPEIKSIEWEVDVENVESEFDHPLISINDE